MTASIVFGSKGKVAVIQLLSVFDPWNIPQSTRIFVGTEFDELAGARNGPRCPMKADGR